MTMCERGPTINWGKYNVGSKNEQFIKIGQGGGELFRPKNFYDVNGCLTLNPVDENVPNLRTKSQRSLLAKLLIAGGGGVASNNKNIEGSDDIIAKQNKKHESPNKTAVSPKGLLLEYVQELVIAARRSGEGKMSAMANNYLHRLINSCIDMAAKELMHAIIEKYASEQDIVVFDEEERTKFAAVVSPAPVLVTSVSEGGVASNGGVLVDPVSVFDDAMEPVMLNFEEDIVFESQQRKSYFYGSRQIYRLSRSATIDNGRHSLRANGSARST
jgi:hypothetical protein